MTTLTIPFPPSVNAYWRQFRGRTIVSARGREYRSAVVAAMIGTQPIAGPLSVWIVARQPDKRRRDLDNLCKCALDGMKAGGAYEDDSQIHRLLIEWGGYVDGGLLDVVIEPLCGGGAT